MPFHPGMRLHYHPLSSFSRKVTIGIGLRGDPIELHTVEPFKGELRSPAFLAMNPFGKMPVLEGAPGGPIFESTSILEYLEEQGPRRLLPAGQEWRCRHFDRLGDLYLLDPIGAWFWKKTDEVFEKTTSTTAKAWALWEKALDDGRPFVCGDAITLADLSAAIAAHYAETEGVPVPEAIVRYRDRLEAHPVLRASREAAMPFVELTKPMRVKG